MLPCQHDALRDIAVQPVVEAVRAGAMLRSASRSNRVALGSLSESLRCSRVRLHRLCERCAAMQPTKARVRKRMARPQRAARVAKPSRPAPRIAPGTKTAKVKPL